MEELIDWLKKYNITEGDYDDYDIIDGYVVMKAWYLNLSGNDITHLPEMIDKLKVEQLYLSDNDITHLPESIGNMKAWYLDLRYNNITHLPESIGNMEVENLYLHGNNIPKEGIKYLERMKNLKVCCTDYSNDLNENILLSKINSRKNKIKLLLD